jgi:hypothetical protein
MLGLANYEARRWSCKTSESESWVIFLSGDREVTEDVRLLVAGAAVSVIGV